MGELSDRFGELMARMAKGDAELLSSAPASMAVTERDSH